MTAPLTKSEPAVRPLKKIKVGSAVWIDQQWQRIPTWASGIFFGYSQDPQYPYRVSLTEVHSPGFWSSYKEVYTEDEYARLCLTK